MLNNLLLGQTAEEKLYVEDVFSTYLYTGNGSTQTITNGIDLAGKGGMVWLKNRSSTSKYTESSNHHIYDTARGVYVRLSSNDADGNVTNFGDGVTSFNSNGFSFSSEFFSNENAINYASWTFRKAPKFFDVLTYVGNGSTSRGITHSLGIVPGMIVIKRTTSASDWFVYHRGHSLPRQYYATLNGTGAFTNASPLIWANTNPTTSQFFVGDPLTNTSGETYVAYLFAHDTTADGIVQCGSFTTDASGNATVSLGWEPQFGIFKNSGGTANWMMFDVMRGSPVNGNGSFLQPNTSSAEGLIGSGVGYLCPTPTGFQAKGLGGVYTIIYLAIRRGPMRVPTDATKVFATFVDNALQTNDVHTSGFPVDLDLGMYRAGGSYSHLFFDRLRGTPFLVTSSTSAEGSYPFGWDLQNGVKYGSASSEAFVSQMFRRAPGFFDVVCYTGTGSNRTVSHNLGVKPELVIIKSRSTGGVGYEWAVGNNFTSTSFRQFMIDNQPGANVAYDAGGFFSAEATSTQITVSASTRVNANGGNYVAYLFSSCPGVSKVGSYTGNGSSQNIDCGFTNGARFVLIKRINSTGDWYVWDTARGIVTANDPHLSLNTSAAEVTTNDSIDPLSSGFTVNQNATTNVNVSSATYIYLAIA